MATMPKQQGVTGRWQLMAGVEWAMSGVWKAVVSLPGRQWREVLVRWWSDCEV